MKKYIAFLLLGSIFTQSSTAYQRSPFLTKWRIAKLSVGVGIAAGFLIPPRRVHDVIWKFTADKVIKEVTGDTNSLFGSFLNPLIEDSLRSDLGPDMGYEMAKFKWTEEHPNPQFSLDTGLRILGGVSTGLITCLCLSTIKMFLR